MSVLVCDCVTASCQPLIAFTHISQLIPPHPSRDVGCNNSLSKLGRRESKELRACKFHGLKRHQHPHRCPCTLELGKHCFSRLFSPCSLLGQPGSEQGVVWSWSINYPQVLRAPKLELHLQWVPAAAALRNEAFPACQSSSSTGIPSGPGKWGGCFTTLIFQDTLKPQRGGFWVFKGTTNLQVHSTLPQLGIYNPVCPERQFGLQKYSVVLIVRYKSQCCNEYPDSLRGVFTGLKQE